jgi:hypothetical protein
VHENSKDWRRAIRRMHDWEKGAADPPRTPLGHPVVSRHAALTERIQEDLRVFGREAHSPSPAYRLQVLYLDFGRVGLAEHPAQPVLRALDVPRDAAGLGAKAPPSSRRSASPSAPSTMRTWPAWASVWRACPGGA